MQVEKQQTLVPVPFHGIMIDATYDGTDVWVSIRNICETIGVDRSWQQERLHKLEWARLKSFPFLDANGNKKPTLCINVKDMPMWLAGIKASGTKKPEVKELILKYQREAADVLFAHFIGGNQSGLSAGDSARFERMETALNSQVNALTRINETVDKILLAVKSNAVSVTPRQAQVVDVPWQDMRSDMMAEGVTLPKSGMSDRGRVKMLVDEFVALVHPATYEQAWRYIYRALYHFYGINIRARTKYLNAKFGYEKYSKLQVAEIYGLLPTLMRLILDLIDLAKRQQLKRMPPEPEEESVVLDIGDPERQVVLNG